MDDRAVRLSWLSIIETIDSNTPIQILRKISQTHKIPLDRTREGWLERFISSVIEEDDNRPEYASVTPENMDEIAFFINSKCRWDMNSLSEAFDMFKSFYPDEITFQEDFEYGEPTTANPTMLNISYLYKIAKYKSLTVRSEHTVHHLATAVRLNTQDDTSARSLAAEVFRHISPEYLSNIYLSITDNLETYVYPPREVMDNFEIVNFLHTLRSTKSITKRLMPETYGEAIVLGIRNFGVDLSNAQDPVKEYIHLYVCDSEGKEWIPKDKILKGEYALNPNLLDLSLNFNPNLPRELYASRDLDRFALSEGYSAAEIDGENVYELMCMSYLSETFYAGKQSFILNEETIVYQTSLEGIDSSAVVCYGSRPQGVMAHTFSELNDYYSSKKEIRCPFTGGYISERNIRKLKVLCNLADPFGTPESRKSKMELLRTIERLELLNSDTEGSIRSFVQIYPDEDIDLLLQSLFKVVMCCRGWLDDSDPHPIEIANVPDQIAVDMRVSEAINSYERLVEIKGRIGEMFNNLPLIKYTSSGNSFAIAYDEDEGVTIGGRIRIIKSGEQHNNYNSCIRLSSNILGSTLYQLYKLLELPEPYDITRFRYIS